MDGSVGLGAPPWVIAFHLGSYQQDIAACSSYAWRVTVVAEAEGLPRFAIVASRGARSHHCRTAAYLAAVTRFARLTGSTTIAGIVDAVAYIALSLLDHNQLPLRAAATVIEVFADEGSLVGSLFGLYLKGHQLAMRPGRYSQSQETRNHAKSTPHQPPAQGGSSLEGHAVDASSPGRFFDDIGLVG